ncbi:MAG TPA: preprotein translocase subunit YajC [Nocardioides sp.]|nr:preprotein translocase subunit YajC [Nocardioides sp.]
MDTVAPFVILLAIALLFWLVMIRPQQRRQQAMGRMQGALSTGDEVMLTSGIIGVVRSLDEKTVELEVSEGVHLRVVRGAVGQVMTPVARDDNAQLAADPADEPEEKQSDGTQ